MKLLGTRRAKIAVLIALSSTMSITPSEANWPVIDSTHITTTKVEASKTQFKIDALATTIGNAIDAYTAKINELFNDSKREVDFRKITTAFKERLAQLLVECNSNQQNASAEQYNSMRALLETYLKSQENSRERLENLQREIAKFRQQPERKALSTDLRDSLLDLRQLCFDCGKANGSVLIESISGLTQAKSATPFYSMKLKGNNIFPASENCRTEFSLTKQRLNSNGEQTGEVTLASRSRVLRKYEAVVDIPNATLDSFFSTPLETSDPTAGVPMEYPQVFCKLKVRTITRVAPTPNPSPQNATTEIVDGRASTIYETSGPGEKPRKFLRKESGDDKYRWEIQENEIPIKLTLKPSWYAQISVIYKTPKYSWKENQPALVMRKVLPPRYARMGSNSSIYKETSNSDLVSMNCYIPKRYSDLGIPGEIRWKANSGLVKLDGATPPSGTKTDIVLDDAQGRASGYIVVDHERTSPQVASTGASIETYTCDGLEEKTDLLGKWKYGGVYHVSLPLAAQEILFRYTTTDGEVIDFPLFSDDPLGNIKLLGTEIGRDAAGNQVKIASFTVQRNPE